ncbi:YdeI/OmpD-associated family protein [Hufsiella ginkgonis]|uniref:DUF3052 family protein n=1 Tax=Hufsiella ginkgonis TaxID=2695274 RepID=A0A7K1XZ09_9SPHI|nr:YdeI/OmpD-associated family protein [Hufsiella ginkgonis]MXV16200.1 hypothetical protein [Hufsiella ginkgonis]
MNPLAKKLLIKPGSRVLLANVPAGYPDQLDPLPTGANVSLAAGEGTYDVVQLFVVDRAQLKDSLSWLMGYLKTETVFWICYPKKSSGIVSDLEMMQSWDELKVYGYDGVAAAAINENWTALRFRPKNLVKKSDASNEEIPKNDYGNYIDLANRVITPPADLKAALEGKPSAMAFFQNLSFTNKKEYVTWVLSAKQEKTRADRVTKSAEKLLAGKKNPSEK